MHLTYLPRNPIPRGLMLRTTVDAVTNVMLCFELSEAAAEQGLNEPVGQYGMAASTTLRLVQSWAGAGRKIVIDDAWFGSLCTVFALRKHGFDSIFNVKGCTAGFCKNELFQSAKPEGQRQLECSDKSFMKLPMHIAGRDDDIYAALHMDKQLMALITTYTSKYTATTPFQTKRSRAVLQKQGKRVLRNSLQEYDDRPSQTACQDEGGRWRSTGHALISRLVRPLQVH
jgi:hypothetical protein